MIRSFFAYSGILWKRYAATTPNNTGTVHAATTGGIILAYPIESIKRIREPIDKAYEESRDLPQRARPLPCP